MSFLENALATDDGGHDARDSTRVIQGGRRRDDEVYLDA